MNQNHFLRLSLICVLAGGGLVGCKQDSPAGQSKFQVAEGSGAATPDKEPNPELTGPLLNSPDVNPAGDPAVAANNGTGGTAEEPRKIAEGEKMSEADSARMMRRLDQLQNARPQGTTPREQQESILKIIEAQIDTGAQIVEFSPREEDRLEAMEVVFTAAMGLQQMGMSEGLELMEQLSKRWAEDKNEAISRAAEKVRFQLATIDLIRGGGKQVDTFLKFADKYLSKAKDEESFEVVNNACFIFVKVKMPEVAKGLRDRLHTAFADSKEPLIVESLKELDDTIWLADAEFLETFEEVLGKRDGADEKFRELLAKISANDKLGRGVVNAMTMALFGLEASKPDLAKETADVLITAFEDHPDSAVKEAAQKGALGSQTRLALIGQPFVVEGNTVDGKPFDWKPYEGKVVLVDFWATWCGPCLEEIPNIAHNYDAFHEQGFEVVGINLDTKLAARDEWLAKYRLPWQTVVSADPEHMGLKTPLAVKCGVEAIPFVLLIGTDGKVDSIHTRGPALRDKLISLLGPPKGEKETPEIPSLPIDPAAPVEEPKAPAKVPAAVEEEAAPKGCGAEEAAAEEKPAEEAPANPYLAKPGLPNDQLVEYLQKMDDKPKVIRRREGFADAVCEACDRILAANPSASHAQLATETKGLMLHQRACEGNADAQKNLEQFTADWHNDVRPRIARLVELFSREEKSLKGLEGSPEEIKTQLQALQEYFATEKLDVHHLRLASNTVALINKLEDDAAREKYYKDFGNLYAKSRDREMAKYGKKLAKSQAGGGMSDQVGKTFEYTGTTVGGDTLDVTGLRGKVVIVDFWATWCGPCLRELPNVQATYEKHHAAGLEIVGISLDEDVDALKAFLEANQLPWTTTVGDANQATAEKYGVRGIPTMMLVDREGKIVGVAHSIDKLEKKMEELLK